MLKIGLRTVLCLVSLVLVLSYKSENWMMQIRTQIVLLYLELRTLTKALKIISDYSM